MSSPRPVWSSARLVEATPAVPAGNPGQRQNMLAVSGFERGSAHPLLFNAIDVYAEINPADIAAWSSLEIEVEAVVGSAIVPVYRRPLGSTQTTRNGSPLLSGLIASIRSQACTGFRVNAIQDAVPRPRARFHAVAWGDGGVAAASSQADRNVADVAARPDQRWTYTENPVAGLTGTIVPLNASRAATPATTNARGAALAVTGLTIGNTDAAPASGTFTLTEDGGPFGLRTLFSFRAVGPGLFRPQLSAPIYTQPGAEFGYIITGWTAPETSVQLEGFYV